MHLCDKKNKSKKYLIIFFLFFAFSPFLADAATLSINPKSGTFETGERVSIKVIASSSNAPFNAVSGTISFSSSIFSVESVSKSNSVLNFWVTEPSISNSSGTVKFEGVSLGGFTGSSGTVITINLRAKKEGEGNVSFKSGQILANDGTGTDITGNLTGGTFTIIQATAVREPPKKQPEKEEQPVLKKSEPLTDREPLQPPPTLKAPEIMFGEKDGAPSVLGISSYPEAQALVTFVAEDGAKVFILGNTLQDGSFNLIVPNSLKRGSYSATAVVIKEDKTNSAVSNRIIIKIGSFFSDISSEIYWLIFILFLLILYLLSRIITNIKKGKVSKDLKKEITEAEDAVRESFDVLREDIVKYDDKKLSEIEREHMSEIKKDIEDAEKIISKEIKDIK